MPITIQEIIASDTISQFVDKTNFNFDQLLLNGGGPSGPTGPKGPTGPAGGRGPKGSTWYNGLVDPTTITVAPVLRTGDYYLQDSQTVPPLSTDGDVWEYDGTTWVVTTTNLQGPIGPTGQSGGFGLSTGAPIFNESNILYNGPIGLNDGANTTNEGVPSIMIGGVTSQTQALTGIPFTAAYIVPEAIVVGNPSTLTSLLIHQRDSNSRGIVFHGGDSGLGDNYEQVNPAVLSNISIGTDDKLTINVPKTPTTPVAQSQMRGIELISESRSQYFRAGADILFQSGVEAASQFAGQHSNFEINVGSGGSNGDGNVFKTITQGTIGTTLLEAGNSSQISLVTNQAIQTGNWQLQAGNISMISSTSKDINLYSGNDLRLNTLFSGGANAGTGTIVLTSGSGGIGVQSAGLINIITTAAGASSINITSGDEVQMSADSEIVIGAQTDIGIAAGQGGSGDIDMSAKGNITIQQSRTTGASGNNIIIRNTMTNTAGSSFLGEVSIESQNQIKLGAYIPSFSTNPKINLQFAPTAGDARVTQFVGSQTWISAGNGLDLLLTEPTNQLNDLTGVTNTEGIFRKVEAGPTGGKGLVPAIKPGFRYEAWQARQSIAGSDIRTLPSLPGKAAVIVLGNESIATGAYEFLSSSSLEDRTMTFSTRTDGDSLNPAFENFSANMDKTAVAGAFVWKRSSVHNSLGNKQPLQEIGATAYTGNGAVNNTNFPAYPNQTLVGSPYGWDYRTSAGPTSTSGMPTTAQLQPFIVLSFGNGVGERIAGASATVTTSGNPPNVDDSFNFPPGAYPGQQVTVMFDNYALQAGFSENLTNFEALWYGSIRLNIPLMRTAATVVGLATESWYNTNDGVAVGNPGGNDGKRNFYEILNNTTQTDATLNITKSIAINLIWDGGVQRTWSVDSDVVGVDNIRGYTQYGWRINGAFQSVKSSRRVNP